MSSGRDLYSRSMLKSQYVKEDILNGKVIKLNPALVTLTDGLINSTPPGPLQERILRQVEQILQHGKVYTFHVDLNFEDYRGFGRNRPEINTPIFSPPFPKDLNKLIRSYGCFLNLHLLTSHPHKKLPRFSRIELGAVCFQLDATSNRKRLEELTRHILDIGACPSPVIETVGSENLTPTPKEVVLRILEPVLPEIGMLTFQSAGIASRANTPEWSLNLEPVRSYIGHITSSFTGTIQLQGGITLQTVPDAINLGAEFLVCGTQLFNNPNKLSPTKVIDLILMEAYRRLKTATPTTQRPL